MTVLSISPRPVYDPGATPPFPTQARLRDAFREYYRDRLSWFVLAVTSVILCYLGGLVLFWYHAVQLGEGGPQISWYAHWLLDSTFAFVGLTPALALILPVSAWAAQTLAGSQRMVPWLHAAVAAMLFAVVTTPGPIAHDLIVGRGTWVANRVTAMVGDPSAPLTPAKDYPPLVELAQQLGAAIPLYLVLMTLTVLMIRRAVAHDRVNVSSRARPERPGPGG
jgi:hypothetical protein